MYKLTDNISYNNFTYKIHETTSSLGVIYGQVKSYSLKYGLCICIEYEGVACGRGFTIYGL